MKYPFMQRVGGVLSADIATPSHERAVRFYARALTTGEKPLWQDDLMNNLGIPIIGVGERSGEYADLPIQWTPHIQVADVGRSAARALELGGREFIHAKDDDGAMLWAGILDPGGAAFGLIPVVSDDDMPPIADGVDGDRLGRIAWLDRTVDDASSIRDFYRAVIGWSARDTEMEDGGERYVDYTMLGDDGEPAAGICFARGVNAGAPTVWTLYIPVGDIAESLRRVEADGGKVIKETMGDDGRVASAVIQDPAGAVIALMEDHPQLP